MENSVPFVKDLFLHLLKLVLSYNSQFIQNFPRKNLKNKKRNNTFAGLNLTEISVTFTRMTQKQESVPQE